MYSLAVIYNWNRILEKVGPLALRFDMELWLLVVVAMSHHGTNTPKEIV